MSDDPITWVVAGVELATAAGIAVFWFSWFRQSHDQPWLPPGYVEHETPFVFADSILAVVLVLGAGFQLFDRPAGDSLGLVAAGMLAFLGLLDLAYFARTGLFARHRDGIVNAGVVLAVLGVATVLLLRFLS